MSETNGCNSSLRRSRETTGAIANLLGGRNQEDLISACQDVEKMFKLEGQNVVSLLT